MDINIASSTVSYLLMMPAPMSRDEWKNECEKGPDYRDFAKHVQRKTSVIWLASRSSAYTGYNALLVDVQVMSWQWVWLPKQLLGKFDITPPPSLDNNRLLMAHITPGNNGTVKNKFPSPSRNAQWQS